MIRAGVSVIIPIYNAEKYLRQCLDSITGQSLAEIEIICVDDGSSDGSPDILKEYAARDGRIKLLREDNKNAGAARNLGLSSATGEYYSFVDADDFAEPDMLEKAYNRAKQLDADIVLFGSDNYIEAQNIYSADSSNLRPEMFPGDRDTFSAREISNSFCAISGWPWDKLFRAELINDNSIRFQELRTSNDTFFVYSAYVMAEAIAVSPEVLIHHRSSRGSLSATRERSWHCFYSALIAVEKQLRKRNLYEVFKKDFANYALNLSLWQIRSLKWPKQEQLFNMMKYAGFERLGVTGLAEEDIADECDLEAYREMMKSDYNEIYGSTEEMIASLTEERDSARDELSKVYESTSYKLGAALVLPIRRLRDWRGRKCPQDNAD